jgi:hypothetical protein
VLGSPAIEIPEDTMNESKLEAPLRPAVLGAGPPSETTRHLAYAEAAFMLIECLMLVLIERGLFTVDEMLAQVEIAIATKQQMVKDGEHAEISAVAASLLGSIANSVAAATRPDRRHA